MKLRSSLRPFGAFGRPGGSKPQGERLIRGIRVEDPPLYNGGMNSKSNDGFWIFSFSDLTLNLLMFFIVLFSVSSIDKSRMSVVISSLSAIQPAKRALEPVSKNESKAQPESSTSTLGQVERPFESSSNVHSDLFKIAKEIEKAQSILHGIEKKKIESDQQLRAAWSRLAAQIDNLKLNSAELEVASDRIGAFEIRISPRKLFRKGYYITQSGMDLLRSLMKEINDLGQPLAINMEIHTRSTFEDPLQHELDQDAAQLGSMQGVSLMRAVRRAGLDQRHTLTVSNLGPFAPVTIGGKEFHELVVFRVRPLLNSEIEKRMQEIRR